MGRVELARHRGEHHHNRDALKPLLTKKRAKATNTNEEELEQVHDREAHRTPAPATPNPARQRSECLAFPGRGAPAMVAIGVGLWRR